MQCNKLRSKAAKIFKASIAKFFKALMKYKAINDLVIFKGYKWEKNKN